MIRRTRPVLSAALLAVFASLLLGCAGVHLADETGRSYRAAVAAQSAATAEPVPPMTAADARRVLRVHTGSGDDASGPGASGAGAVPSVSFESLSSGMSGGGMWQGASGGIRLEAK